MTTAFSREHAQRIYKDAVVGASDAPRDEVAAALARLLSVDLQHLAVVLCWLLDKRPQRNSPARTTHKRGAAGSSAHATIVEGERVSS
jgi:SRSO17 transposase